MIKLWSCVAAAERRRLGRRLGEMIKLGVAFIAFVFTMCHRFNVTFENDVLLTFDWIVAWILIPSLITHYIFMILNETPPLIPQTLLTT